jgi:hypothetical protein
MDLWLLSGVGLGLVILGLYLLWRLWGDAKGRPGLIFMVGLMVTCGGGLVWAEVARMLAE